MEGQRLGPGCVSCAARRESSLLDPKHAFLITWYVPGRQGLGSHTKAANEVRYFIIRKITPKVLISVVSKKLFPVLARVEARAQWCSGASGSAGALAVGFLAPHDESTQLLQKPFPAAAIF